MSNVTVKYKTKEMPIDRIVVDVAYEGALIAKTASKENHICIQVCETEDDLCQGIFLSPSDAIQFAESLLIFAKQQQQPPTTDGVK